MKNIHIATMIFFVSLLLSISCNKESILTFQEDENIPPISVEKADYYVATNGNDNNPGTFDQPWASWQKAFDAAQPGDTVYIRGGVYGIFGSRLVTTAGAYAGLRNGTTSNYISIFGYPGETPILDCENASTTIIEGIYLQECKYWHLKGLEVKNVMQKKDGSNQGYGFQLKNCDNIIIENCVAHDVQGSGFKSLYGGGKFIFINCDSYNNFDPYTTLPNNPGGNADGFCSYSHENTSVSVYRQCRAWNNSDDGFDTYGTEGVVTFDSCWSFRNGYWTEYPAGVGFKLGAVNPNRNVEYARVVRNCIAFGNKNTGIGRNSIGYAKMKIFNNTVVGNGYGIDMRCNIGDAVAFIRNNISFDNFDPSGYDKNFQTDGLVTDDHNSWNGGVTLTVEDFQNTDPMELVKERKEDGSLPDINFLKPVPGSDLIDAGLDIGLLYWGAAPDLGAFEN